MHTLWKDASLLLFHVILWMNIFLAWILHTILSWSCHLITHHIKDQDRNNDLISPTLINFLSSNTPILNPEDIPQSVIFTNTASAFVDMTSDSDLYHHRITSNVSGGASCHACTQQRHSPRDSHIRDYLSTGVPNWVCVSKSLSSLSLCTQCASIAHSQRQISNIASHCRNHRARKKFNKQQCVLCEVAIPCNQHKLLIQERHPSSLLMDSLGSASLYLIYMLKTKQTPIWVCHVLGLKNSLPFIWLPHSDALSMSYAA
jgi:hypothetical protein